VAAQFGLPTASLNHHFKLHVSERYKAMVGASHIDSFETLLANATAANMRSSVLISSSMFSFLSLWSGWSA
jgi:hypothetical protein